MTGAVLAMVCAGRRSADNPRPDRSAMEKSMSEWQRIEAAPKQPAAGRHGPRLLMTDGALVAVGYFDWHDQVWKCEAETVACEGPGSDHGPWEWPPLAWSSLPEYERHALQASAPGG